MTDNDFYVSETPEDKTNATDLEKVNFDRVDTIKVRRNASITKRIAGALALAFATGGGMAVYNNLPQQGGFISPATQGQYVPTLDEPTKEDEKRSQEILASVENFIEKDAVERVYAKILGMYQPSSEKIVALARDYKEIAQERKDYALSYNECKIAKKIFEAEGIEGIKRKYKEINKDAFEAVKDISLFHLNYMTPEQIEKFAFWMQSPLKELLRKDTSIEESWQYAFSSTMNTDNPQRYAVMEKTETELKEIYENEGKEGLIRINKELFSLFSKGLVFSLEDPKAVEIMHGEIAFSIDFLEDVLLMEHISKETIQKLAEKNKQERYEQNDISGYGLIERITPQVIDLFESGGTDGLKNKREELQDIFHNRRQGFPLHRHGTPKEHDTEMYDQTLRLLDQFYRLRQGNQKENDRVLKFDGEVRKPLPEAIPMPIPEFDHERRKKRIIEKTIA